jgi:hypothetical protein
VGRTAELAQQTFPRRSVYNVMGQLLIGMGLASYENYARRIGDVEGVRRAALAVVTMRAASVATHDILAALATSPFRDPYTGRPFEWDGEAVVFRGSSRARAASIVTITETALPQMRSALRRRAWARQGKVTSRERFVTCSSAYPGVRSSPPKGGAVG